MATVTLDKISKSYDQFSIIKDLDLKIEDGEFVVLVGASGCGKSTTLRMIAGLETTSSGSIQIGSRDVTDIGPGQRNCAMVFQNYALYPHMTVAENIGFGLRLRGKSKTEIATTTQKAATSLGLQDLLHRKPKALSGGQRQRVAIGRAIVREPDVFLFDEPLSNLDAKLRIEMRSEIKALHRRMGSTIVYVTHDQVEAMTMADRVVVMDKGKIIQAASPLELYEKPANIFVAGFIGAPSMNFIECEVVVRASKLSLFISENMSLPIIEEFARKRGLEPNQKVVLGLRPEHVTRGTGPVEIMVKSIEPLGSHTLAIGCIGDTTWTVELDAHDDAKPDNRLPLNINLEKAHFFNSESGVRIL
jgi:multiple sugar transport system ATP-binding protein